MQRHISLEMTKYKVDRLSERLIFQMITKITKTVRLAGHKHFPKISPSKFPDGRGAFGIVLEGVAHGLN